MAKKRAEKNAKDAHFRIEQSSSTWREVRLFCEHVIARACAVLEDSGAPMVLIRQAQGDVRTARAMLKLASPDEKPIEADVPEPYPSGGPED